MLPALQVQERVEATADIQKGVIGVVLEAFINNKVA